VSCCKLVLASVAALSFLLFFKPEPLAAAGLAPNKMVHGPGLRGGLARVRDDEVRLLVPAHFRRATSYYCYPRNYWWFYRPYTTAEQGYARCMPYFHYPAGPSAPGRSDRAVK
jgi:hypothetical protein